MQGVRALSSVTCDREYRRFGIALLLAGVASSCGMPLLPIYLATEVGIDLDQLGLITSTSIVGGLLGVALGRKSDLLRRRATLVGLLGIWLGLGWLVVMFSTSFWHAVLANMLLLSMSGALNAQIYACVNDTVVSRGEGSQTLLTSALRTCFSAGYMLGPLLGAGIVASTNLALAFLCAAALNWSVALVALKFPSHMRGDVRPAADMTKSLRGMAGVALFSAVVLLVSVGDHIRATYLPVYVVQELEESLTVVGVLVAVAVCLELGLLPLLGWLGGRIGCRPVIAGALVVALADYSILATSTEFWHVLVSQALHAILVAAVQGVGLGYVQELGSGNVGLATSVFFLGFTVAKCASGLVAAPSVAAVGLSGLFWIPCLLCVGAFLGLLALPTVHRRLQDVSTSGSCSSRRRWSKRLQWRSAPLAARVGLRRVVPTPSSSEARLR